MEKHKYNIGDKAWKIDMGKAVEVEIYGVAIYKAFSNSEPKYIYSTRAASSFSVTMATSESDLFSTKDELIKSL